MQDTTNWYEGEDCSPSDSVESDPSEAAGDVRLFQLEEELGA